MPPSDLHRGDGDAIDSEGSTPVSASRPTRDEPADRDSDVARQSPVPPVMGPDVTPAVLSGTEDGPRGPGRLRRVSGRRRASGRSAGTTDVPAGADERPGTSPSRRRFPKRVDSGAVLVIAAGAGTASLALSSWFPFLPFYMLELGATTNANALFWVGVAIGGQGIARFVAGPVWGMLSDRLGRKVMYIRALYFATATTVIATVATEPWHVALALACQGFFSGFIPAAVALTSVIVPESRLSRSLGIVTAAQYLGATIGPAVGAGLVIVFGLRGALLASAVLPAIAATVVLFVVPRDTVEPATRKRGAAANAESEKGSRDDRRMFSVQFGLAVFVYFVIFGAGQMLRLTAPVSIADITGESATGIVGIAFTAAGIASVVGVTVSGRVVRPGRFSGAIAGVMVMTAVAHVLLAVSATVALYVAFFALISFLQASVLPASNTLIALNVPRARRGTAFGIASSAQALGFIVGPMGAAVSAAVSLSLGNVLLAVVFGAVALLTLLALREPAAR